jgi:hypothetical protein
MTEGIYMIGKLLCSIGLHRVVTTREGKVSNPQSSGRGAVPRVSGAATHIHVFCYRPDCDFHTIIDTHSGNKISPHA